MMAENLDIYVRIAADAARYAQGLQGASRETKRFADHARSELGNLKRELAQLGLQLGAVGLVLKGIKTAGSMQGAMLDVEGNIRKTTMSASELEKQLGAVRDTAVDVSKAMPFSAKEVVQIQNSLLKAGVGQDAIIEKNGKHGATYAAAGLATLAEVDPGQVGDMLARIGSQFRFSDKEYAPAADTLMRGEAASPGNLQEIMYSLRQFGSNAKGMGIGIKEATAASAALTPLGLEAGTAMNRFLEDSIGKTKQQQKALKALGLGHEKNGKFHSDFFENGKFIGLDRSTKMVRDHLSAIKDDALKIKLATKAWGEEGARAALIFANADDDHSFAGMKKAMEEALGIEERMKIKMRGFDMSVKAAAGTLSTTLGLAFDPFLDKLSTGVNMVNDLAGDLNKIMMGKPQDAATGPLGFLSFLTDSKENGGLGMTGKEVGIGALTIGGLMSVLPLARKLAGGSKALKGALGNVVGIGGEALELGKGIAVGKTLQAAAGVTPVYVVNMPNGGISDPTGGNNGMPGLPGGPGKIAPAWKTTVAAAGGMPIGDFLTLGASAWATAAAGVLASAAAGYGFGTAVYKTTEGTKAGDWLVDNVGGAMAKVAAWFGSEDDKRAVALTEKLKEAKIGGTVDVKITAPGNMQVETTAKPTTPSTKLNVGRTMQGAN